MITNDEKPCNIFVDYEKFRWISVKINQKRNWPYISNYLYRILIMSGSRSDKSNMLLNLIKHQRPDVDKIYF